MKISELIEQLNDYVDKYGDQPISIYNGEKNENLDIEGFDDFISEMCIIVGVVVEDDNIKMSRKYVFVVTFDCAPEHYNVYATVKPKLAILKKIQDKNFNIEIWLNNKHVGTYGDQSNSNNADFDTMYNELVKIIEDFEKTE